MMTSVCSKNMMLSMYSTSLLLVIVLDLLLMTMLN